MFKRFKSFIVAAAIVASTATFADAGDYYYAEASFYNASGQDLYAYYIIDWSDSYAWYCDNLVYAGKVADGDWIHFDVYRGKTGYITFFEYPYPCNEYFEYDWYWFTPGRYTSDQVQVVY